MAKVPIAWISVLLALGVANGEKVEVKPKVIHSDYFDDVVATVNVEGPAVVLKSNLPYNVQNQLAATLTSIYQTTSDPMQRLQQLQTATTRMYPMYWNVVSNFDNVTYFNQYYIYFQINRDRILAFGLN
ncbi:hypothetical protein PPYR_13812 [Photinus pyralis]|uniref:Uncharacterized protein n=1 Tax=Photinus pyralis TaxID=7054 RepID=A0A1Y1KK09_PHOPY|nr:uncharacterized protein LOC116178923 [Photinus pyralis]KAB0794192.1 hypothetical protein PPYR_13812 [Photinus pyralis]